MHKCNTPALPPQRMERPKRIYRIVRDVDNADVTRISVEVHLVEGKYRVRETFFYTSTVFDKHGNEHPRTSRSVTDLGIYNLDHTAMRAADEWFRFNNG
jgi:hypothetical protein